MKKISALALLLAVLMLFAGCSPKTYQKADPDKYVTLGQYKGLTYTPVSTTVSDYQLQAAINNELKNSGYVTYQNDINLTEGTVQLGDTINLDYKGLKDGVAFEGGTASGQSLTIGSGQFIDGFEEGLEGKAIGSELKLNLTFPENYSNAAVAGAAVVFEVKINAVTSRATYQELTDELAALLNKDVKTAAEFKEAIKKELEDSKKAAAINTIKNALWIQAVDNATVKKLPKKLLEDAKELYNRQFKAKATQNGHSGVKEFVTSSGLTMKQYDEILLSYAEPYVKVRLVGLAIAKAEGYEPTAEELRETAEQYAAAKGYADVDKCLSIVGEDEIRNLCILDHVFNIILENSSPAA